MNLFESIRNNLNESEKLPELPEPYHWTHTKDGRLGIEHDTYHYDLTDYCFAYCKYTNSEKGDIYGLWAITLPKELLNKGLVENTLYEGYEEAFERLKELDSNLEPRWDRT